MHSEKLANGGVMNVKSAFFTTGGAFHYLGSTNSMNAGFYVQTIGFIALFPDDGCLIEDVEDGTINR
jgi:hypothetical protein